MADQERNLLNPDLTPREDNERALAHPEMVVPLTSEQQKKIDRVFEDKTSGLDLNRPFKPGAEGVVVVPNADMVQSEASLEASKSAQKIVDMIKDGDFEGLKGASNASPADVTNALLADMNDNIESDS